MANFGKEGKPEPVIAKISQETSCLSDPNHALARERLYEQVSQVGLLSNTTAT